MQVEDTPRHRGELQSPHMGLTTIVESMEEETRTRGKVPDKVMSEVEGNVVKLKEIFEGPKLKDHLSTKGGEKNIPQTKEPKVQMEISMIVGDMQPKPPILIPLSSSLLGKTIKGAQPYAQA